MLSLSPEVSQLSSSCNLSSNPCGLGELRALTNLSINITHKTLQYSLSLLQPSNHKNLQSPTPNHLSQFVTHMGRPLRLLLATPPPPAALDQVNSDFVVILAALLCALICFLGLIAVARCAWLRRVTNSDSIPSNQPAAKANKGLKKKVLRALPTQPYSPEFAEAECAICLAEFADGDQLRVLPQCGHGFHVSCIDTWLGSHSSCPSCRQILVIGRCRKCGGVPAETCSGSSEARRKEREDGQSISTQYLP